MANAKAAFILPTSGSGVNGPSITSTWNSATYQAPVQASIVEPEAGLFGSMVLSTSYAQLTGISAMFARSVKLKNKDTTNAIRVSGIAAPSATQYWEIAPGETLDLPYNRVAELYFAGAAGTPTIQWAGV
jgi:hypothetical protein